MTRRLAVLAALFLLTPAGAAGQAPAPGAPGAKADWTRADKQGFGTAMSARSKVWFTLSRGELTEVYHPTLGTPSVRDLELIVSDGRTFTERESEATTHRVEVVGGRSLTFRQVNTAPGRYRITKTYVTDPDRDTVLVDVDFRSLSGRAYDVYVHYDPALSNDGGDDRGSTVGRDLVASDARLASAVRTVPALRAATSGYVGRSDGWRDLEADHRLDHAYVARRPGNVVQTARTALTGRPGANHLTLALGFGRTGTAARGAATASLRRGFGAVAAEYAAGWERYLSGLKPPPAAAAPVRRAYDVSLMVLRASEDKTYPGASIASPSMPWAWAGDTIEKEGSAPYHLVWSRDLYQVATAQLAAGDRPSAERALDFLLRRQQKRDGSFPQNSQVDGTPKWTNTQLDEVALPIVLAWQLGRTDDRTYASLTRAADYLLERGPRSPQERWENQAGWSPGTLAAEIAGLVCAADIAQRRGDTAAAARWMRTADVWQANVDAWTVTTNGPWSPQPYYLRLTKNRAPNRATTYNIGDSGPAKADQRRVVDPSFLELVRLGVKPAGDPVITNTVAVVDRVLKVETPNGAFWRRFTFDGYGETRRGGEWDIGEPDSFTTLGRAWPIFAGERGEYELAAGRPAVAHLIAMAAAANEGEMIPEQVWDGRPPTGRAGFAAGEGTFSATPLAWSHAQLVRLAWSIDAGRPVERPSVVACRYAGVC